MLLIPLHEAQTIAAKYVEILIPHCTRIVVSGDIRRKEVDVRNITIVCIPKVETQGLFVHPQHCVGFRAALSDVGVIVAGSSIDSYTRRRLKEGPDLHLYMATEENWEIGRAHV